MKTYLSLTIGPIYKTLNSAKKTRDLWGGSYIFSYIMKKIIQKYQDRKFIVPYIDDKKEIFKEKEVGLFHDRFIFEATNKDTKESLQTAVEKVIKQLEEDMGIKEDFLKNYLQISIVEKEVKINPILKLTPYLDTKELFFKVFSYDENLLLQKLQGDNSFLKKEAFGNNKSFPSLPEIALRDIWTDELKKKLKDDELSIYEDKELKKELNPYHKYIAIVHADGDNMGKVVESLKDTDFSEFSKALFDYCIASHNKIKSYGGETIFAGGDDLLFFAPVVNKDKTIFNLLDDISKEFDNLFKEKNKVIAHTGKQATLSFGVSITYYKYPLYEALKSSRDLLFEKAKSGDKNNIAFTITKHSGQTFGGIIPKNNKEIYEKFIALTSSIDSSKDSENFLHSLHHKLYTLKEIVDNIATDRDRLTYFFQNYFNKQVHKKYEKFFNSLVEYMHEIYSDEKITDKLELIYGSLRFVKFIKGDKS